VRIRDAEHGRTATQLAGDRLAEIRAQVQLPAFGEVEEGISEKAQVDKVCAEGCKGTCEVRVRYAKVAYGYTRVGGSRVEREEYSKGLWRCAWKACGCMQGVSGGLLGGHGGKLSIKMGDPG